MYNDDISLDIEVTERSSIIKKLKIRFCIVNEKLQNYTEFN